MNRASLLSREGTTQGCPQCGILNGLGLLLLAEYLWCNEDPQQPLNSTVLQPRYADNMANNASREEATGNGGASKGGNEGEERGGRGGSMSNDNSTINL